MEEINPVGYLTGIKVKEIRTLLVEGAQDIFDGVCLLPNLSACFISG